ncbi:MAG: terminase [Agitococcus sp.]|nr:terminase [Agitococcus sp.]
MTKTNIPLRKDGGISFNFRPKNEEELKKCLSDPLWRICSGALYKIIIKGKDGDDGLVLPFKPNRAQRRLLVSLWHRNLILKARQLGFTTMICILWLDTALFNANMRCGIIAQDREAAEAIFKDKVKFAYENLPENIRKNMPLKNNSAKELRLAHNNSSIRVATSMRSGMIHRLHISEFGKICAKYPDKAKEVITGSIPAVPLSGILVIESTAEGRGGDFHDITMRAKAQDEAGKELTVRDYRFHFYPWWDELDYQLDTKGVLMTDADRKYFTMVEAKVGTILTERQRAWYVATRDADFSGSEEKMWQEYPSFPDEAFQVSTQGCYFTDQISIARKQGRIGAVPLLPNVPCNTFWDIGSSDGTAIWVHQRVGQQNNFVRFKEGWGEAYGYYVQWLFSLGVVFHKHYLPHDADHIRQGKNRNESPRQMLEDLMPGHQFETVDRVQDINWGIQKTRDSFASYWFDEENCKDGIVHLESYKKIWSTRQARWSDEPDKSGGHSEAADALRQHAQGYEPTNNQSKTPARNYSWKVV